MSAEPPVRAEIEAELALLLASAEFEKNRGASNFLKFVVGETSRRAWRPAESLYHRHAGAGAERRFRLPVQFRRARAGFAAAANARGVVQGTGRAKPGAHQSGSRLVQTFVSVRGSARTSRRAAACAKKAGLGPPGRAGSGFCDVHPGRDRPDDRAGLAAGLEKRQRPAPSKPAHRASPERAKTYADFAQALEVEFSAFDNVIVKKPEAETPAAAVNAYALALRPSEKDYVAELLRLSDQTIVWAGQFPMPDAPQALARQARELAQTIGDAYGVIDVDALRLLNDFDGMPRGFNCTLKAFSFLKNQSVDRLRVARACLETAVQANAKDDDARAMLAIVLVHYYFFAPAESDPQADLARAEKLAQEAFELAPSRARSFFARFLTLFATKRYDEAFAAARTALALNGNSTLFAWGIGAAYVLRGQTEEGLALLSPLVDRTDDNSAALGATALAHDLRGERRQAEQLLARPGASERALALILQMALCGDAACARERAAELHRNFPGIAADIGGALDRMGMTDAIKARLLAGRVPG